MSNAVLRSGPLYSLSTPASASASFLQVLPAADHQLASFRSEGLAWAAAAADMAAGGLQGLASEGAVDVAVGGA